MATPPQPIRPISMLLSVAMVACFWSACSKKTSSNSSGAEESTSPPAEENKTDDQANEDDFGPAQPPSEIAGINLVEVDYDNARVSCNFSEGTTGDLTVDCAAVALRPDGSQALATDVKQGVSLTWAEPKVLQGSATNSCVTSPNTLRYTCAVAKSADSSLAKIQYQLNIAEAPTNRQRSEITSVVLPYSVGVAAGLVATIPFAYETGSSSASLFLSGSAPSLRGLQPTGIPVTEFHPPELYKQVCVTTDSLFMLNDNNVYRMIGSHLEFYAGDPSVPFDDLTEEPEQLKTRFSGVLTGLACSNDSMFISSMGDIKRVDASGEATIIAGDPLKLNPLLNPLLRWKTYRGASHVGASRTGRVVFEHPDTFDLVAIDKDGTATKLNGNLPAKDLIGDIRRGVVDIAISDADKVYVAYKDMPALRVFDGSNVTDIAMPPGFNPRAVTTHGETVFLAGVMSDAVVVYKIEAGAAPVAITYTFDGVVAPSVEGLALDKSGNLLLSTGHNIHRLNDKNVWSALLQTASFEACDTPRNALTTTIPSIQSIVATDTGAWFFNAVNQRFSEILVKDGSTLVADRFVKKNGAECDDALAADESYVPEEFSVTSDNQVVFTDSGNGVLVRISTSGAQSVLAGCGVSGACNPYSEGMSALNFDLGNLTEVLTTAGGTFVVLGSSRIYLIRNDQTVVHIAGTDGGVPPGTTSDPLAAKLKIQGLSRSNDGTLVFGGDNLVFKITPARELVIIAGDDSKDENNTDGIDARETMLSDPGHTAITNGGVIFFIDDSYYRRVMRLDPDPELGPHRYRLSRFFGGGNKGACGTGSLRGRTTKESLQNTVLASLGVICSGDPVALSINDSCPAAGGKTRLLIAQIFGSYTNVVEVATGCTSTD